MCKTVAENVYECNGSCGAVGTVWGTGVYTNDSNVFVAARHMNLVPGVFTKIPLPGLPAYVGCAQNGINTVSYGVYGSSYVLVKGNQNNANQMFKSNDVNTKELINEMQKLYVGEMDRYHNNIVATLQKKQILCSICMKNQRSFAVFPCGHAHFCDVCIKTIMEKHTCAVCSAEISGSMKIVL